MLYGEEKRRQMARSILPSTRDKGSRDDLRLIARAHRSRSRAALRTLRFGCDDELEDQLDIALADAAAVRRRDIKETVFERRLGDKLGPVMRWAPKAVAHLDRCDRMPTLRSWLPDDLAGRHACSHLAWMDELNVEYEHMRRWWVLAGPSYRQAEAIAGSSRFSGV